MSPTISSLIRDRKQNVRIYHQAVYAGASFFSFFFNCYSPRCRDIILSPACVRRDILRTETVALLLFFSFFRIITIGELER